MTRVTAAVLVCLASLWGHPSPAGEPQGWLAGRAEALGVEIYPGFAAADVLYADNGAITGVVTGDMGVERDGTHGPTYQPGIALMGKYVLIGEGVRGSLA